MQDISSEKTSRNKLDKIYKILGKVAINNTDTILDYGCGKFNTNKNYAIKHGYEWHGYDPYNRSESENQKTNEWLSSNTPSFVVCTNVLNVINDDDEVENVVKRISQCNTMAFFTIWEGNRTGVGAPTSDGYQRNEKVAAYLDILNKYFKNVSRKKNIFTCY